MPRGNVSRRGFALGAAGAGLFGLALGMMAPVMTLMMHLIWGAVLGYTYDRFQSNTGTGRMATSS